MKSFVINLKRDINKKQLFLEKNSKYLPELQVFEAVDGRSIDHKQLCQMGLDTDKHWRDHTYTEHLLMVKWDAFFHTMSCGKNVLLVLSTS